MLINSVNCYRLLLASTFLLRLVRNTTKTQFIKTLAGGSLLNKVINNLPVEMHLPGHNFTGPGTKLNKRLNPDLTPSKPINRVDKAAYHHDLCY